MMMIKMCVNIGICVLWICTKQRSNGHERGRSYSTTQSWKEERAGAPQQIVLLQCILPVSQPRNCILVASIVSCDTVLVAGLLAALSAFWAVFLWDLQRQTQQALSLGGFSLTKGCSNYKLSYIQRMSVLCVLAAARCRNTWDALYMSRTFRTC